MADAFPHPRAPWGETFRQVADGWLFSDLPETLPAVGLLPLENPDSVEQSAWAQYLDVGKHYRSVSTGTFKGSPVALFTPKLGAPAAAMLVDAAAQRGLRVLIGLGYCGAISDRLTCGDLLAPSAALSGDGTSGSYAPARYPAVADLGLLTALHAADPNLHDGLVHSLDAVYTQDDALVDDCARLRVDALDMETSAVLTVARLRGCGRPPCWW